jgi:dinuclear metal center YbgI/SA1388 family protein
VERVVKVQDVHRFMSAWAPPAIAWDRDNVGLQYGDPDARVRGILASLDPTEECAREALARGANLIVTHHPLLFLPLRTVTPASAAARCLELLVRGRIALYSAHTNLDFARNGTSFTLASKLGLEDVTFLEPSRRLDRKIVTFVPAQSADRVASAMAGAGAGVIGNYDQCSFRVAGTGTFHGNEAAAPFVGRKGNLERVPEIRLEMITPQWAVEDVLRAVRHSHPYDEVALDVFPLENKSGDFGMGAVGTLPRPVRLSGFLAAVKRTLGAGALRWCGSPRAVVRRVALCGGSGGDLLESAVRAGADVFLSADLKYHAFREATGRIALIDAGHYETEVPVVGSIVAHLRKELRRRGEQIPVHATRRADNPVRYV